MGVNREGKKEMKGNSKVFGSNSEENRVTFFDSEKTSGRVVWGRILRTVFWKNLRSVLDILVEISEPLEIGIWSLELRFEPRMFRGGI